MIGSRDRNGIDALVRQRFANVSIQLGPLTLRLLNELRPSLEHIRIRVAECHVFGFVLLFENIFDVAFTLPVEANRANANSTIYVARGSKTGTSRRNYASGAGRQKGSS